MVCVPGPRVAPILSVIIVTYRSRAEISACLGSIPREIDGGEVEVFVVENASGDGIGELVRERFPWVRLMEPGANLGFSKANNLAYDLAGGECVLFLNPDTISNRASYEHCLGRLRAEPDIGFISPRLVMANGEMDLACRRSIPTSWDGFCRALGLAGRFPKVALFSGYNLTHLPVDGTYSVGAVNGAFMMARRAVLRRIGVFDEQFFMYGDDLDLCYRATQAGYRVVYDGGCEIVHLKGMSSSQEPEKMAREVFRGTEQFYRKHFNPSRSRWVTWRYAAMFRAWQTLARVKARLLGYKRARPL
jgi:GT2 family glycosyltransferase